MSNHQSSQSAIVNKLKKFGRWSLTLLPEFLVLIQLKVKCLRKCDQITAQLENKLLMVCVLWMNNSQIHRNMKIVQNGSMKAMERILEQALSCSLEGQWWLDDCGWLEITMKDLSMISVAHSCFFLFHFWTPNCIYYTGVSYVWFSLLYISLKPD